jgi:uncharacterized protein (DUF1501 family)
MSLTILDPVATLARHRATPFVAFLSPAGIAAALTLAAPAHALSDQQRQFVADVSSRGVNGDSVIHGETQETLGDAVCADLEKGNAGANEVTDVANQVSAIHGSMSQAKIIVYWAITDLCTDQMSQRQDPWRDGQ